MYSTLSIIAALAASFHTAAAVGVTGAAEGFAKGVTGGGSAAPVYPKDTAELISYLGDNSPRVIVLSKTYDFTGTEGTASGQGCAPWGTGAGCQVAINQNDWCKNYQASAPTVSVSYDKAGISGIPVKSNKSLVGTGSAGIIKGKGLRISGGAKNIIIQNVAITDLNPRYVWGGDAITLDNADMVWIDHVTTARIGRQHIVLGMGPSGRVTISNNYINGESQWSATCNGYHYWGLYFTGSSDLITLKGNYIYHTSGRAPKVGGEGNTVLHAVNNYFYDNAGHAFEIATGGNVLAEGNVFQNIKQVIETPLQGGQWFSSPDANANSQCTASLGRACQVNGYGSSPVSAGTSTGFLANFKGKNVASAVPYTNVAASVQANAGQGKL